MRAGHVWFATVAALCFAAAPAYAQGRGHGHGNNGHANGHGNGHGRGSENGEVVVGGNGGMVPPGIQRQAEEGRVPPGLAKKGGLPPGQARKMYTPYQGATVLGQILGQYGYPVVRTRRYGSSRYVYYRRPDGSLARAIVAPGSDQLTFRNVPAQILQAVLARLY